MNKEYKQLSRTLQQNFWPPCARTAISALTHPGHTQNCTSFYRRRGELNIVSHECIFTFLLFFSFRELIKFVISINSIFFG